MGYQSLFLVDIEGFPLCHVEASLNVNEKKLVEPLLDRLLGEDIEVELVAGYSQFESQQVFNSLRATQVVNLIALKRCGGRENPLDVPRAKHCIDVKGHENLRIVYRMRVYVESLKGRVSRGCLLAGFPGKGHGNACIHTCLVFCMVYATV